LIDFVYRLKDMWKTMSECHRAQEVLVAFEMEDMLDDGATDVYGPSQVQRDATSRLGDELSQWIGHLGSCVEYQKKYIADLYAWSQMYCRANGSTDRRASRGREDAGDAASTRDAHVFQLLKEWGDSLQSLESQCDECISNMKRFASDVHLLKKIQSHELKLMRRRGEVQHATNRGHTFSFRKLELGSVVINSISSGRSSSNGISSRWWEERGRRSRKLDSAEVLREHLPNTFKSLASFAEASWKAYENIQQRAHVNCTKTSAC
jgi:hypothetical protein